MARLRRNYTGERRSEFYGFQLTPSERRNLDRLAQKAGMLKSEVIRSYLPLGKTRQHRRDTAGDDTHEWRRAEPWKVDAVREINRIGVNINQLTHRMNQIGHAPETALLRTIATDLKAALNRLV
jgi:hypothetical protein